MTDEQRLCIECGCPVHYGSRHHHCGRVAMKYMARIAALEKRLAEAEALVRDVRGTLRTDQYDGHRKLGQRIDNYLRKENTND